MRLRDIFSMAGAVLNGAARQTYWVKNEDGTASILVRMSSDEASREKVAALVEEARRAVEKIGRQVSNGGGEKVSCNAFLGKGRDSKLEAVGMATLKCDEAVEKRLGMMNLMQVS